MGTKANPGIHGALNAGKRHRAAVLQTHRVVLLNWRRVWRAVAFHRFREIPGTSHLQMSATRRGPGRPMELIAVIARWTEFVLAHARELAPNLQLGGFIQSNVQCNCSSTR